MGNIGDNCAEAQSVKRDVERNESNNSTVVTLTTVVIANRQTLSRVGIRHVLNSMGSSIVLAETEDAASTRRALLTHQPEYLIFEPEIFAHDPNFTLAELKGITTSTNLIAIMDRRAHCCELMGGISLTGGILQSDDVGELEKILTNGNPDSPQYSPGFIDLLSAPRPCSALTERERQIMKAILQGKTSRDIGGNLGISLKTVENHRANLMRKLNVHSVAELSQWARNRHCVYGLV